MRTGNMSMNEAMKAEKAVADRQQQRVGGYKLMRDRDRGSVVLSNGVRMIWPTPKIDDDGVPVTLDSGETIKISVHPPEVPEGKFVLDGTLYDTEEFRKWLRWC